MKNLTFSAWFHPEHLSVSGEYLTAVAFSRGENYWWDCIVDPGKENRPSSFPKHLGDRIEVPMVVNLMNEFQYFTVSPVESQGEEVGPISNLGTALGLAARDGIALYGTPGRINIVSGETTTMINTLDDYTAKRALIRQIVLGTTTMLNTETVACNYKDSLIDEAKKKVKSYKSATDGEYAAYLELKTKFEPGQ